MPYLPPRSDLTTHEVTNQPAPRGDIDLWSDDPALIVHGALSGVDEGHLAGYGLTLGSEEMRIAGQVVNRQVPELVRYDAAGRRVDEVRVHPSYNMFLQTGLVSGYAALPWEGKPGGHATHATMVYLASQVEPGHCCPLTMTYAAVPALAADPDLAARWTPKLTARAYDPRTLPIDAKSAATLGMAMTEKQGGSDVRANTTTAQQDGARWRLRGHKWFCSAPMSDGFLTLAQAPAGLTCFLVPRWLNGERNAIHLMRLKNKLGNTANASAEIEYHNALAYQLGEPGRGVQTIIEMVHHTRLDTAMAPAGIMRGALTEAMHWVRHRSAFQRRLIDQPLMRAVLADLMLDWEGATRLGLHVAAAFDRTGQKDRAYARIAVALAKFLNNKLCPRVTYEAMEALGGVGYIEDTPMPLYYREAPLNGIWEGSGNVICLDILRTLAREPGARETLDAQLDAVAGTDRRYDAALDQHRDTWRGVPDEADARRYAERTALLLTASVLLADASHPVADGFIGSRIAEARGHIAGTTTNLDTAAILNGFDG